MVSVNHSCICFHKMWTEIFIFRQRSWHGNKIAADLHFGMLWTQYFNYFLKIQFGGAIKIHYYRNANLSRLGNLCCPGFPTGNARPGQKGVLLSRVWQPGQKLLSRLVTPTETKGAASATWLAHPFVPVGVLPTGTKGPFFFLFFFSQFFFNFNYTFAFQLNLCIVI